MSRLGVGMGESCESFRNSLESWLIGDGRRLAFLQQRAVPPLWLRFASADVSWVIWIEVVITVLCRAMPCYAVPCRAVLCRAVLCRAMPCYAVLYRAMPCRAVPCLPCSAVQCRAAPCRAVLDRILRGCTCVLAAPRAHAPWQLLSP